jgi:hypothetical protein
VTIADRHKRFSTLSRLTPLQVNSYNDFLQPSPNAATAPQIVYELQGAVIQPVQYYRPTTIIVVAITTLDSQKGSIAG